MLLHRAACNNIVYVYAPNATAKTSVSICRLIDLWVAFGVRMGCNVNSLFPNNCYHRRTSCVWSRDKTTFTSGAESLLYLESVIKESTSWKLPRNQFRVTTKMFSNYSNNIPWLRLSSYELSLSCVHNLPVAIVLCVLAYEYKLIASIHSELLNIFKMLELTLRVSAIICVLVACFNPTIIAFVTNDNCFVFICNRTQCDRYGVRAQWATRVSIIDAVRVHYPSRDVTVLQCQ